MLNHEEIRNHDLNVLYAEKEKIYPAYVSNITQIMKNKLFFNYFKQTKTMALSCSKKAISIIERNSVMMIFIV